uniref:acrosin n=1 Tax=Lonchura striata TaxID=40157 RepID=UPI000B4C45E4|nr:acrosin [Lonchura striata domestica]
MALLGLLVLLALAGPVWTTWDTCRGTCGLRPLASDHSSSVLDYDSVTSAADLSRVVAGTGVQPGAWPGIVSIQATWENGTWHMCSGVLLSSQWVLTVAHCFARAGGISRWEVVMGVSDLSQPGPEAEVRHIQRLLVHQHYVPATARNDIALVELDRPVECSDYIQLGCVPDASIRVLELKSCYIAGWNFARGEGMGMVLRESKVHLIHTEICNSSRWYGGAVHADNLCAGYPQGGIDTCQGDSGNPLICKDNRADYYWLVGLNSWGRGCDRARRPGIYTSTQHFYNWILIQTGLSPADITGSAPEPNCAPTPKPEVTMASAQTTTPGPEQEPGTKPRPAPGPTPELVPVLEPVPERVPVTEMTPEPTPGPEPVTKPTPEPTSAPQPSPEPVPVPEPTPVPVPEPTGETVPEATTEPATKPTPEPAPVPMPEPKPVPEPTPELVPEPSPEPATPLGPEHPVPTPAPAPDRLLVISVSYQSLLQFCNLLRDFLQFLRDQLG